MIGPHEAEVIIGFGGIGWIELNRFLKKFSRLVVKTSLLSRSSIFKIKLAIDDFASVELSFMERFLKHGERLLCPFRFAQNNCQHISNLRRVRKAMLRIGHHVYGPLIVVQLDEQQLGEVRVIVDLRGIDQKALLVIRGGFGIFIFGFLGLLGLVQCFCFLFQHAAEQFIRLILFRMLLDDLLQHLGGFCALMRQQESRR